MGDVNELKAFIDFLKSNIGFDFNVNFFNDRLKVQKYVFLAKFLGWNHNYHYNLYIRGPYCSELADDYYNLDNLELYKSPINSLDQEKFVSLVYGKSIHWLEASSTMMSLYHNYQYQFKGNYGSKLIETTHNLKPNIPIETLKQAYADLMDNDLLN
jgi:hypothetical protein